MDNSNTKSHTTPQTSIPVDLDLPFEPFLSDLLKDEPEKDAVCTLDLQEDLPDSDHKTAAMALGTALITKEFSEFEKLLDEEVSLALYDDRTIRGKDAVASYWRNFLAKENDRNKDVDYQNAFIKKLSTPLARCVYSALTLHGYKAIEYNFHYQHYKNYDKN